jgi:hypothetical protein
MSVFRFLAVQCTLIACLDAGVLVNQPLVGGGILASQNDTKNPGGFGVFAVTYDNFTLASGATIGEIDWIGGYFNPGTQSAISQFTITFYNDSSGIPGSAVSTLTSSSFNETADGSDGAIPIFTYAVTGALVGLGAGTYWVSIVPDLAFPPQWGWENGSGGDGNSYQLFFGQGSAQKQDQAFTLLDASATPEPATMALIGLGLGGVGLVARGRAKK